MAIRASREQQARELRALDVKPRGDCIWFLATLGLSMLAGTSGYQSILSIGDSVHANASARFGVERRKPMELTIAMR